MFPRKTISLENDIESHDTIGLHNDIVTLELSEDTDFEGRPSHGILERSEDMYSHFGIEPDQVNSVSVLLRTPLEGEELQEWNTIVKPAIEDRCSKGTHDLGCYKGEAMHIEVTSNIPISRPITEEVRLRWMSQKSVMQCF